MQQKMAKLKLEGKVKVKENCVVCGAPKPVAHHPDYNEALTVIWLCYSCHALVHKGKIILEEALHA